MLNNYIFTYQRYFYVLNSELPQKPDREPVENLSKRHKADPKAKSTETAKAGDEVQPSHLWISFEFWNNQLIRFQWKSATLQLTKHRRFSKEDVHDGDVLFIGIVVHIVLITKTD